MINIPPIKQSANIKVEIIPELTRTWKVGQILNATTQRGGEALSDVLIRVGQQTLQAKTPVALQSGQELKLLVKSLNEFQTNSNISKLPQFSIIEIKPATDIAKSPDTIAAKLRQFIAVQQSFTQLQQSTANLLNNKLSESQLNPAFKSSLNQLQQSILLTSSNLSTASLKQKIMDSGIFFEPKISTQISHLKNDTKIPPSLNRDFKFQLLSIKAELTKFIPMNQQQPPEILTRPQLETLQLAIKNSLMATGETKVSDLINKLVSLLPKSSLIQISNLLSTPKPDTTIPPEIQSIAKLLISTLQLQGNQQKHQLLTQLEFRLQLLDLNLQIDQSISKITSLQLQPLLQTFGKESDSLVLLLFNLVFKDAHEHFDIDFRIQQDENKEDCDEESWTVILSFNFKTLGKVQTKIHLVGDMVSSVFYTELASTAEKIKKLLPILESGLTKIGLKINNLAVENSILERNPIVNRQINLLDENA